MEKNELRHLAVILDGNGRWAEKHFLSRAEGHKEGAKRVLDLVQNLEGTPVRYLTLYAFSTENWNRSKEEVSALMSLLCEFLDEYTEKLLEQDIRLLVMGCRDRLPEECLKRIDNAVSKTSGNKKFTLIFALNYGGRAELADAVVKIAEKVQAGTLKADSIDEQTIAGNLYLPDVPDPDLLIRTGGELRVSNFLLWQISYTEFYFTNVLWPDFGREELFRAMNEFQQRKRNYGGRH